MSTQGIVSIIRKGNVTAKIVAGCNGYEAEAMAKKVQEENMDDPHRLLDLAKEVGFGCDTCLVVQTEPCRLFMPEPGGVDEMSDASLARYADHFSDPNFNPRLDDGRSPYVFAVVLEP